MNIIFDSNCTKNTKERNFPESKHRSKRILKKLLKRYKHEFKQEPAMFQTNDFIISHPIFKQELSNITKGKVFNDITRMGSTKTLF